MKSHLFLLHCLHGGYGGPNIRLKSRNLGWKGACLRTHDVGGELMTWLDDDVDRLHVKRNRLVGMNYLGIID